ncbi:MAG: hypothetical protein HC854_11370, partial [Flavobacterium sp.]|nr:hypothetical protein [Flavobacterium sp.]
YLWNIKGDYRAQESYAYLTGRNSGNGIINNPRNEGFFTSFSPFYDVNNGIWNTNKTNWTSASSITKYSPYGAELENKDALNRYSAAQYGYQYTLPMAVASNAKYSQMGFEGFEETMNRNNSFNKHFAFSASNLNLDTNNSHTGKRSIKVANGQKVALSRSLKKNLPTIVEDKCPTVIINPPPVSCISIASVQYCFPSIPQTSQNHCTADSMVILVII